MEYMPSCCVISSGRKGSDFTTEEWKAIQKAFSKHPGRNIITVSLAIADLLKEEKAKKSSSPKTEGEEKAEQPSPKEEEKSKRDQYLDSFAELIAATLMFIAPELTPRIWQHMVAFLKSFDFGDKEMEARKIFSGE
jgi:hypothetical protein